MVWQGTVLPAPNTLRMEVRVTGQKLANKIILGSLAYCKRNLPGKGESQALLLASTYVFFTVYL